jgi:hypothetical protein
MKFFTILSILLISSLAWSSGSNSTNFNNKKNCKVLIEADDIEVKWTGYKFPGADKKGVSGTLRNLGIKDEYKGQSLKEIFTDLEFNIDGRSVWSRNSGRDARLVKFFFGKMIGGTFIKGKILSYEGEIMKMKLNMNGLTKTTSLNVVQTDKRIEAKGVIDILDWGMQKSLNAINQECHELHKGKTWSDVNIHLSLSYRKDC